MITMTAADSHMMANHHIRKHLAQYKRSSSSSVPLNTINESQELYSTVTPKIKRNKRRVSPPNLPPSWGQDVAPPPTPFYTPQTSPGSSSNGIRMGNTLQRGNEVEVINAGTYEVNMNSQDNATDVLNPMTQRIHYASRYHTEPQNRKKKSNKQRSCSKNFQSNGFSSSTSIAEHIDHHPHRSVSYCHEIINARNQPNLHCDDNELIMVRSDDVITYSYRFGKGGSINRYPIEQVQQPVNISGSRNSMTNGGFSRKVRHRKNRRQRYHNNVSPEGLVTIEEIPFLTNYSGEDAIQIPQQEQRFAGLDTHGRGYFVGDTKIYDNNLALVSSGSVRYRHDDNFNSVPSHIMNQNHYTSLSRRTHNPLRPPPNSQSSSPIYTGSSGTSPEAPIQNHSNQLHPSSPASPDSNISSQSTVMIVNQCRVDRREPYIPYETQEVENPFSSQINQFGSLGMSISSSTSSLTQTTIQRRSAMKMPSSNIERYPRKTVQWLIDTKKRPEDISQDRKVVKHQVGWYCIEKYSVYPSRNQILMFELKCGELDRKGSACKLIVIVILKLNESGKKYCFPFYFLVLDKTHSDKKSSI